MRLEAVILVACTGADLAGAQQSLLDVGLGVYLLG